MCYFGILHALHNTASAICEVYKLWSAPRIKNHTSIPRTKSFKVTIPHIGESEVCVTSEDGHFEVGNWLIVHSLEL